MALIGPPHIFMSIRYYGYLGTGCAELDVGRLRDFYS